MKNIDIDKGILQNIDIDKILYRLGFGISNTPMLYRLGYDEDISVLKIEFLWGLLMSRGLAH